jgi:hypothetical protein
VSIAQAAPNDAAFTLWGVNDETLRQGAEARNVRPEDQAGAVADERRRIKAVSNTMGRPYRSKRQEQNGIAPGPGSIRQPLLSEGVTDGVNAAGANYECGLNITDNYGKVGVYARYFKDTESDARTKGLLRRVVGPQGWAVGRFAGDQLYTRYRTGEGFTEGENRAVGRLKVGSILRRW